MLNYVFECENRIKSAVCGYMLYLTKNPDINNTETVEMTGNK